MQNISGETSRLPGIWANFDMNQILHAVIQDDSCGDLVGTAAIMLDLQAHNCHITGTCTEEDFNALAEELTALARPLTSIPWEKHGGQRMVTATTYSGNKTPSMRYLHEFGWIQLNWNSNVNVQLSFNLLNRDAADLVLAAGINRIKSEKDGPRFHVLSSSKYDGLVKEVVGIKPQPLERQNYQPEVCELYDHVVECIKSSEPCGRLSVFDGPPGTGKTFLVRALMDSCPDADFLMIPPQVMTDSSSPDMMKFLISDREGQKRPLVLIIEDADECIASRDRGSLAALSNLLNLSSGLYAEAFDIRVICTTNSPIERLDEAVMRDCRLCRHLHVGELFGDQATKVLERLAPGSGVVTGSATLANIYRRSLGGPSKKVAGTKKVGF